MGLKALPGENEKCGREAAALENSTLLPRKYCSNRIRGSQVLCWHGAEIASGREPRAPRLGKVLELLGENSTRTAARVTMKLQ